MSSIPALAITQLEAIYSGGFFNLHPDCMILLKVHLYIYEYQSYDIIWVTYTLYRASAVHVV